MKKFLLVMVVAILALALVACGGDDTTTTETTTTEVTTTEGGDTTTTVADNTTTTPDTSDMIPDESSTEDDGGNETPEDEAVDMVWDSDRFCLSQMGGGFCTFEVGFGFDGPAVVLNFTDGGGIYNDLVLIDVDNTDNTTNWTMNQAYIWELTIDGQVIEVQNFSVFNNGTSGWIRLDTGADFSFDKVTYEFDADENAEVHSYTISLRILDSNKKPVYYATLCDPEEQLVYKHHKPESTSIIVADNRNPNYQVVNDEVTPISGPGSSVGEGYENLFDGKSTSKICTSADADAGAVTFKFDKGIIPVGFAIVNANDNAASTGRTVVKFTLYGSSDGNEWTPLLTETGLMEDGVTAIDKTAISTNYLERYYEFENSSEYSWFKFVPENGEMWQASEIYLFEDKE